mgnify:CR=1 FL=1
MRHRGIRTSIHPKNAMTLYHGSNVAITEIDLQKGRKGKDNTYNTEQLKQK